MDSGSKIDLCFFASRLALTIISFTDMVGVDAFRSSEIFAATFIYRRWGRGRITGGDIAGERQSHVHNLHLVQGHVDYTQLRRSVGHQCGWWHRIGATHLRRQFASEFQQIATQRRRNLYMRGSQLPRIYGSQHYRGC